MMASAARTRNLCAIVAAVVALTISQGCSRKPSGPLRYGLKGKVTSGGVPVLSGMLAITPDTKKGNSGPGATIFIGRGVYEVGTEHGVVGGPHIVQVTVYKVGPVTEALGKDDDDDDKTGGPTFQKTLNVDLPKEGGTYDFEF